MELIKNKPIGIRESERISNSSALNRKKIRRSKKDLYRKKVFFNYPVFHMWFRFLKLSLELEELGYSIPKRGAKGKVLEGETRIVVNREFYAGWNLEEVLEGKWNSWCRKEMRDQLIEMGVKPMGKPQYDSLSKRYNVYVRYFNANPQTYEERTNLSMDLINRLEKVRFERVSRDTNKSLSEYTKLIWKEVKAAEATILNVMSGQFP
ncbi:MAG: hypothetical protein HOB55_02845 [Euryarchaeota archaeon]|nr:hypothetical protein [Euryarchaeota archaeon]